MVGQRIRFENWEGIQFSITIELQTVAGSSNPRGFGLTRVQGLNAENRINKKIEFL